MCYTAERRQKEPRAREGEMMMVSNSIVAVDEEICHKTQNVKSSSQEELGMDAEVCALTTFRELMFAKLGLEDLYSLKVWRASMAELVGTAVLVFAIDTVAISSFEAHVGSPNVLMAVFAALAITVLLLATFPISGGHLNPAITLSAALLGVVSLARAAVYVLAQCAGAVLGALLLEAILPGAVERNFSLGGCTLAVAMSGRHAHAAAGIGTGAALWLEVACTFALLLAVRVAFDEQHARALGPVAVCGLVGAAVGLMAFVSATVTGKKGYAGAGMNPARCLGPAVVRGGQLWQRHWVFWVGPAIACGAFSLYARAIPQQHFYPRGREHGLAAAAVKVPCATACGDKQQAQREEEVV